MVTQEIQENTKINDGRSDFDFFFGTWKIQNRRLKERLKDCTEWEEFEGRCTCRPVLDGTTNMDEGEFYRESGTVLGMTVRLFDPKSKQWRIYWADNNARILEYPMVGSFNGKHGEFYSQEPFEGRIIICRFLWESISPDKAHWEQAFSTDGGKTWETNWIMNHTRIS